jgi:autotransporter passenger strand-loop-strand repeat protein
MPIVRQAPSKLMVIWGRKMMPVRSSENVLFVDSGKTLFVDSGKTVTGITLGPGNEFDRMDVNGGTAVGTTVLRGGHVTIFTGTTSNTKIEGGGGDVVAGIAKGTSVFDGNLFVFPFGTTMDTVLNHGGRETVEGVSNSATLNFGGLQVVRPDGVSNSATVLNGREELLGGISFLTTVAGGKEEVAGGGVAISTTVSGKGMLFIHAGSSVQDGLTLANGGTAEIHGSMTSGTVTFAGQGGDLKLFNLPEFAAVISGFGRNDLIDLGDFAFSSSSTVSFSSGTLTVTDGNKHAALTLSGPYSTSNFTLASDGGHGTLIKFV